MLYLPPDPAPPPNPPGVAPEGPTTPPTMVAGGNIPFIDAIC